MGYDEQSQMGDVQPCTAKANAPLGKTMRGVKEYLDDVGAWANKTILGVPWYGYVYPCTAFDPATQRCQIESVPFRRSKCSDAAGKKKPFGELLATSKTNKCPRVWDRVAAAPFFTCKMKRDHVQVWYDDPQSLALKYAAAKRMGLRGVGMWTANFLDYANHGQVKAMWGALPPK